MKRTVITGIGLVTPLGIGTETTWNSLVKGCNRLGLITLFDASSLRTQLAGEIPNFEPQKFVTNRRMLRTMTRGDQLAFAGTTLALDDSHLELNQLNLDRTGLFFGGNKEMCDPMVLLEATMAARNPDGKVDINQFIESAQSTTHPLLYVLGLPAACLYYVSETYGFRGANGFFVGTGEASAVAIGTAHQAIRRGEVDVAIAGGFDDPVCWWTMTKLDALQVMTDRNDLGAVAYKPYDKERTGTIIGEGAAFLVLEEYEAAVKRGARIYAEVTGFGSGYDSSYGLVTPEPTGRGLTVAMQTAIREAGTTPAAFKYLASHGSGTKLGDSSETRAIQETFGSAAARLEASSVKPATGHLVAASGALNAAVAALAIHHQTLPPTLNLQNLDPECKLDWIPNQSRQAQVEEALALSRGMEGQNVAIAIRRV